MPFSGWTSAAAAGNNVTPGEVSVQFRSLPGTAHTQLVRPLPTSCARESTHVSALLLCPHSAGAGLVYFMNGSFRRGERGGASPPAIMCGAVRATDQSEPGSADLRSAVRHAPDPSLQTEADTLCSSRGSPPRAPGSGADSVYARSGACSWSAWRERSGTDRVWFLRSPVSFTHLQFLFNADFLRSQDRFLLYFILSHALVIRTSGL